jgi:hypothetical protein
MKWLILTFSLVLSFAVMAENTRPWWQVWKSSSGEVVKAPDNLFTTAEKTVLLEYLKRQGMENRYDDEDSDEKDKKHKHKKDKKQKSLPPGLQKKVARGGELPPGWQKKVARGEVLDGGLYEASTILPVEILGQIESKAGTSVRQVEDRVVRILDATHVILDVLTP